jgi:hypothetical protein
MIQLQKLEFCFFANQYSSDFLSRLYSTSMLVLVGFKNKSKRGLCLAVRFLVIKAKQSLLAL